MNLVVEVRGRSRSHLGQNRSCANQLLAHPPPVLVPSANHQPSGATVRDQKALFRSLICTVARRNPTACGTHQGNTKRGFAHCACKLPAHPASVLVPSANHKPSGGEGKAFSTIALKPLKPLTPGAQRARRVACRCRFDLALCPRPGERLRPGLVRDSRSGLCAPLETHTRTHSSSKSNLPECIN